MKKLWKRNAVVAAVLVLVCAAIYLNGRYAAKVEEPNKVLGQSTQVDAPTEEAEEVSAEAKPSDYFATARLTRKQARDSAISLLREASEDPDADSETASEAAKSIQTLASYTLSEAQIENMITAKGYADCVVFLADDSVSVVVSTETDGLQTEDVARITDIVKQETGLPAEKIKILEVN
ncbi:MAG: SpoIIIAH-like family protein [Oscillospiraceae bacterium]|nr:SpoIIIAH-like family protein [Oscillospiraceae bacterium]MBQ2223274.1 SpoIIIAH-like family protein [Oscillospiraceae bacterium]